MAKKRHFTARDINAIVPQLEKIFDQIQHCTRRAEDLAADVLRHSSSNKPADVARAQMHRSQVDFLLETVQKHIEEIEALGGITKDIEMGLVDFLGDVEGQDVWLCWRRGERKVNFWHPLDGGYAQRRALPRSNRSLHE